MPDIPYPLYERNLWRSRKIPLEDIPLIKERYNSGEFIRSIAKSYNVHYDTIYKTINDDYREKVYEKKRKLHSKKYAEDKEYRERCHKNFRNWKKIKKGKCPTFQKWNEQQNKKSPYYGIAPKNYYLKNKEKILKKAKEKYWAEKVNKNLDYKS